MREKICIAFFLLFSGVESLAASQNRAVFIGSRRELFLDRLLVERLQGCRMKLHHPVPRETVLKFQERWEGRYSGYVTVIKDGPLFRMYYRGLPESDRHSKEVTCYAESRDGVHWKKPHLGLYKVGGSPANNIILKGDPPFSHNFCPFLDKKPNVDKNMRYKALAGLRRSGLFAFVSEDGIHWRKLREKPVITKGAFDSQNVSFWSSSENRYVCYFRIFEKGFRSVARTTSDDFINWSEPLAMTYGDTPREHIYTNQTRPYFRAPHIYVSVCARFFPGKQVVPSKLAQKLGVEKQYIRDCSEAILMCTRGGNTYSRTFMEAFIRPGLGYENWTSRTNYPAYGIVPTSPEEISIYVQRSYGKPNHRLVRYTLRTDGFVSINAPYTGGMFLTKPLVFQGKSLYLNFSTSAAGKILVEIQDVEGKPIEGFSRKDCKPLIGDLIEGKVNWKGGKSLEVLFGKPVRLCFLMWDSDLYSLHFGP